jgi:hypothetical protein
MTLQQFSARVAAVEARSREGEMLAKLIAHLGRVPSNEEVIAHGRCFIMHDGIMCYTWDDKCFASFLPPFRQIIPRP